MGEHFVYILQCGDGTLYTGYAKALGPRFAAHRAGKGAKYTKGRSPLKIIYFEQHGEKGFALKREATIKKNAPHAKACARRRACAKRRSGNCASERAGLAL